MAKKTAEFIAKLSQDHKLLKQFLKDPHAVMDKHGLSAAAKKALTSRDHRKVMKHLGDDAPPGCFILIA
jgi:hypothetical protein